MKKLLVVLGLSAIAMAGKCSSSEEKSKESAKTQEEFPAKEDNQVPAEEVPSYEQQDEAPPADGSSSPAPMEASPAPETKNP